MRFEGPEDRLIVALDMAGADALALAGELQGTVSWLKVGMTLFYEQGPTIVLRLSKMGFRIFLDLKLHDIPHQVEGAARTIAKLGVDMITVHASGGSPMIEAAVRGAHVGAREEGVDAPAVLAVTVLTSMNDAGLASVGIERSATHQVPLLAKVAQAGGADGVVCSPNEATVMRELLGDDALVVTPGVRPADSDVGDQSRVATPASALRSGASQLVVGRPITAAPSPVDAARSILEQMKGTDT